MSEEIALDAVGQRYRLKGELGRGGMSVVYEGLDPRIGRQVAIKLLHPHLAVREDARRRFLQEAKAIARLENPNILKVYDYDSPNGSASYIVSEFIDGITFKAWCEQHQIKHWEVIALLAVPLFKALDHAHQQQVIHRDVKPENMMIRQRDGSPVLMDFGIAHMVDSETLTATGAVIGSPAHMAPEVVNGEVLTCKADLFSMGTVLYWMCCGTLPFVAPNPAALFRRILEARFDPIQSRRPEILGSFARIIERCMARDPEDRPVSAQQIAESLEDLLFLVGLKDIDIELARLSASPERFQQELSERLAPTYCDSAKTQMLQGNLALGLELVTHVLQMCPDNLEAQKLERDIQKCLKQQSSALIHKYALGALIFALVLLLVSTLFNPQESQSLAGETGRSINGLITTGAKRSSISEKNTLALSDSTEPKQNDNKPKNKSTQPLSKDSNNNITSLLSGKLKTLRGDSSKLPSSLESNSIQGNRLDLNKSGQKKAIKRRVNSKRIKKLIRKYKLDDKKLPQRSLQVLSKAKQRVDISSIYKGVTVTVNGKEVGHIYEIDRAGGLDLRVGEKHSIIFRSPFCETHREVLQFKRLQSRVPRLVFECRFKDAKFKIKSTQQTEIFLNGDRPRKLGSSNQTISFPMKATQSTLSLLLMTKERQAKSLKIKVAAGQYKEIKWR